MGTETFAEWLDQYLQNGGRGTQARLAEQLHIRSGTITRWRDGMIPDRERIPDIAKAVRLSKAKVLELIEASERDQFRRVRENVLALSDMVENDILSETVTVPTGMLRDLMRQAGWGGDEQHGPDLTFTLPDGTVIFVEVRAGPNRSEPAVIGSLDVLLSDFLGVERPGYIAGLDQAIASRAAAAKAAEAREGTDEELAAAKDADVYVQELEKLMRGPGADAPIEDDAP